MVEETLACQLKNAGKACPEDGLARRLPKHGLRDKDRYGLNRQTENHVVKPPRDRTRKPSRSGSGKVGASTLSGRGERSASPRPGGTASSGWSPLDPEPAAKPAPRRALDAPSRTHADPSAHHEQRREIGKEAGKGKDDWKLRSPRRKFRDERAGRGRPAHGEDPADGLHLLYGMHTVREALKNPRRVFRRLLATENGAARLAEDGPMPIEATIVKAEEIGRRLTPDAVHQGVLLEAEPLAPLALGNIPKDGLVLALDQVTDPHNVGAILRSAAAFGVDALLITERHSPEVTGVLAKAASGALEHVPFAVVRNLSDGLETLKKAGFLCVGFDSEAPAPLGSLPLTRPLILVMGAEGKGLRQKTRETCSALVRLEMPGVIKSLNVSNAAAIALYAATSAIATVGQRRA